MTAGLATRITLGSQWTRYAIQLGSLLVLTRFLSPSDYGVLAMASAVVGLAAVVGDFGLSLAALRATSLSDEEQSSLFWINFAIGVVVGGLTAVSAPLLADFYGQPAVTSITLALSAVFCVNGAAVQFRVRLNREARYLHLAVVDTIGPFVAFGLAIGMALNGSGVWALVAQQLIGAVVTLAAAVAACRWTPRRPHFSTSLRQMLQFGGGTFATQVFNYVTTNLDSVVVGRFLGAAVLGLYSRAFTLAVLPLTQVLAPLTRVMLPRLAGLGPVARAERLWDVQRLLAYGVVAPLALLASIASSAIELVFGARWAPASSIFTILAVGAAFQTLGYVSYWLFLAAGRTKDLFFSEFWGRCFMVAAFIFAARFSAEAVALAVVVGQAIIWGTSLVRYAPRAGMQARRTLQNLLPAVVVIVCAAALSEVSQLFVDGTLVKLLAGLSAFAIVFGGGILLSVHVRSDLRSCVVAALHR